jgi:hypothetical protein
LVTYRHRYASGLLALLAAAVPSTAAAEPLGAPWATINGVCNAGGTVTNQTGQVPVAHPFPVVRLTALGGPASWTAGGAGPVVGFTGGDVVWSATDPLPEKQSPTSKVSCPAPQGTQVPFKVEFFDAPTVPTSFDGRASRLNDTEWGSLFVMLVPQAGFHVADVELRQGAARVCAYSPGIDFGAGRPPQICADVDRTQSVPLGTLDSGPVMLTVVAQAGPSADYTFAVRPAPAPVVAGAAPHGATFSAPFVRPSGRTDLAFSLAAAGAVSAGSRTPPAAWFARWRRGRRSAPVRTR